MDFDEIKKLDDEYHISTYTRLPVQFVLGEGSRLWDETGKEYLDFLSGLGAVNIGHCHPAVSQAVKTQIDRLVHVSNLFYVEPQARLAEKLSALTFGGKVFFANSGAEANEGAIKLARRHSKINFDTDRVNIITALRSFHGRTMKTLAATGQRDKQVPFEPMPPGFAHVPLNDVAALEAAIDSKTCAVMLEVIQGEGGVYPCDEEYLTAVRALCEERRLLLILDEVQTGIGRTGKLFAYEHYGIEPDIMTTAKALANGLPIGALIAKREAAEAFRPGDHGSTFGGGPVVCAAALATLGVIESELIVEKAASTGAYFRDKLEELAGSKDAASEVRGRGLMLAVQLTNGNAKAIASRALEEGFVINAIGDGILRFLPPLVVEEGQIDSLVEFLDEAIE